MRRQCSRRSSSQRVSLVYTHTVWRFVVCCYCCSVLAQAIEEAYKGEKFREVWDRAGTLVDGASAKLSLQAVADVDLRTEIGFETRFPVLIPTST